MELNDGPNNNASGLMFMAWTWSNVKFDVIASDASRKAKMAKMTHRSEDDSEK